jgi:hypothetical protein
MNKKWDKNTFLKEKLDDDTLKLYYFRIDEDENYECEEYIYKDKNVLDLKHGQSSKLIFDNLISKESVDGTSPIVYFEYKKMGFKAFDEDFSL